jgi:hypothetical protein
MQETIDVIDGVEVGDIEMTFATTAYATVPYKVYFHAKDFLATGDSNILNCQDVVDELSWREDCHAYPLSDIEKIILSLCRTALEKGALELVLSAD